MIYKLFSSSFIQGAGAVSLLVTDFVLAKNLLIEDYGQIVSILNWIAFFTILSVLGVNQTYLKLIPEFRNSDEPNKIAQLLLFGMGVVASLSLLIVIITITLSKAMPLASVWSLLLVALIALPFAGVNQLLNYFLRSHNLIRYGLMNEFLIRPISFLLLILLIGHWAELNVKLILIAFILSHVIATTSGCYLSYSSIKLKNITVNISAASKKWLKLTLPVFLTQLFGYLSIKLDIVILSLYNSNTELAIYNISAKIAEPVVFILVALNAFLLPTISIENARNNHYQLIQVLNRASKISFYIASPLLILIIISADTTLGFFGDAYRAGSLCLIALAIGQFASILAGPVAPLLMILNKANIAAKAALLAFILNVLLCIIFIPYFGIVGAAFASASAMIGLNLYQYIYLKKNFQQHFSYLLTTILEPRSKQ